jgi:hypothetical protein
VVAVLVFGGQEAHGWAGLRPFIAQGGVQRPQIEVSYPCPNGSGGFYTWRYVNGDGHAD